jgi:hypothetical protein
LLKAVISIMSMASSFMTELNVHENVRRIVYKNFIYG